MGSKSFNYSRRRLSKAAGCPFIHRPSVKTSRNVSSRDLVFFNVEHSSRSDKRLFCAERKHSLAVDAFRTSLTIRNTVASRATVVEQMTTNPPSSAERTDINRPGEKTVN